MKIHARIALLWTMGIAAISTIVVGLSHSREPQYQGKSLSEWLRKYNFWTAVQQDRLDSIDRTNEAIRQMGDLAIPFLIRELTSKRSWLETQFIETLSKLSFGRVQVTPVSVRHHRAISACEALGQKAEPAIPALAKLLEGKDRAIAVEAADALAEIGPRAALPLSAGLFSRYKNVRVATAWNLRRFSPTAVDTVPFLVKSLDDSEPKVRRYAAVALSQVGRDSELTIPALRKSLSDEDPSVRGEAAISLKLLDYVIAK